MDKTTRNIFLISLLGVAAVVWYIFGALTQRLVVYFDLAVKYSWIHSVENVLPILLGATGAYLIYRIDRSRNYILEVINEVKKVVWPPKKETKGATIVVIITVLISAVILALFDWISTVFMNLILR
jgi:preprotein translocase subunit SecE